MKFAKTKNPSHSAQLQNVLYMYLCCITDCIAFVVLATFKVKVFFVINKACIQCRTGIKLKSYKGMPPCLPHFIRRRFNSVELLLRLAALSSKAVTLPLVFYNCYCGSSDGELYILLDVHHSYIVLKGLTNITKWKNKSLFTAFGLLQTTCK